MGIIRYKYNRMEKLIVNLKIYNIKIDGKVTYKTNVHCLESKDTIVIGTTDNPNV